MYYISHFSNQDKQKSIRKSPMHLYIILHAEGEYLNFYNCEVAISDYETRPGGVAMWKNAGFKCNKQLELGMA